MKDFEPTEFSSNPISRRDFLKIVLTAGASLALPEFLAACKGSNSIPVTTTGTPSTEVLSNINNPTAPSPSTSTETPVPPTTETPVIPSWVDDLPQGVIAVKNVGGSCGIGIVGGGNTNIVNDVSCDLTGLHVDLGEARVIDIAAENVPNVIKWNSEFGLLQIYEVDQNGKSYLSAEFDPGQGDPSSPDYISGQGWVDIWNLGKDMSPECFIPTAGQPRNSVWITFIATGIFRKVDIVDTKTSTAKGNLLITQFITKNANSELAVDWTVVQAESFSRPGYGDFVGLAQTIQAKNHLPYVSDAWHFPLYDVDDWWKKWMPEGSYWSLGYPKYWMFADWPLLQGSQIASSDKIAQRIEFVSNAGVTPSKDAEIILISNASQ